MEHSRRRRSRRGAPYPHYWLGLDLGQRRDYSALTLLEEMLWVASDMAAELAVEKSGWIAPSDLIPEHADKIRAHNYQTGIPGDAPVRLVGLKRFNLGTKYYEVVDEVKRIMITYPLAYKRKALAVDVTGVGRAVLDNFYQAGVRAIGVNIHGGTAVHRKNAVDYSVPKRELVIATQRLFETNRIKIAGDFEHLDTLIKELDNFKVNLDPKTAHDSYSHWRESDHDDLVLSCAMACWYRHHFLKSVGVAV